MNQSTFKFKQFTVDQTGCAMKINTDGVLLGAMAGADNPASVLDIGTGTGVIALMLAQRFVDADIDAVEIDLPAANTAALNFKNSIFSKRLTVSPTSIENFDEGFERKYDLIVSNPPFYLNSLESPEGKRSLAKHTDAVFFERLMKSISRRLTEHGCCWLIFPFQETRMVNELISLNRLYLQKTISIHSFEHSAAHRQIVCFGREEVDISDSKFVIYEAKGVYSEQYKELLKPYFLAF